MPCFKFYKFSPSESTACIVTWLSVWVSSGSSKGNPIPCTKISSKSSKYIANCFNIALSLIRNNENKDLKRGENEFEITLLDEGVPIAKLRRKSPLM